MLTLMQMLECLTPTIDRSALIKCFLDELISETEARRLSIENSLKELATPDVCANASAEEKSFSVNSIAENQALELSYRGVLSSLHNLKKESIAFSIATYAEQLCPDRKFGQASPREFVKRCYSLRSSLTHSGTVSISDSEFSVVIQQLRELCLAALHAELDFDRVELQKEWAAPAEFLGGIQFEGEPLMSMHEILNPAD